MFENTDFFAFVKKNYLEQGTTTLKGFDDLGNSIIKKLTALHPETETEYAALITRCTEELEKKGHRPGMTDLPTMDLLGPLALQDMGEYLVKMSRYFALKMHIKNAMERNTWSSWRKRDEKRLNEWFFKKQTLFHPLLDLDLGTIVQIIKEGISTAEYVGLESDLEAYGAALTAVGTDADLQKEIITLLSENYNDGVEGFWKYLNKKFSATELVELLLA